MTKSTFYTKRNRFKHRFDSFSAKVRLLCRNVENMKRARSTNTLEAQQLNKTEAINAWYLASQVQTLGRRAEYLLNEGISLGISSDLAGLMLSHVWMVHEMSKDLRMAYMALLPPHSGP